MDKQSISILLQAAQCPANCDNGAIPRQVAEDEWEPEQCQFCDERERALAALASQPAAQVDNDRSLGHLSTMYVLADARTDLSRRERALLQQMYADLKAALAAPSIAEPQPESEF